MPEAFSKDGASLKLVHELFSGDNRYLIPHYQRPFEWPDKLIWRLYSKLLDAWRSGAEYKFLGQVIVYKDPDTGQYEIVDGQQRFVSIVIFIRVLMWWAQEHEKVVEPHSSAIKRVFNKTLFTEDDLSGEKRPKLEFFDERTDAFFAEYIMSDSPSGTRHVQEGDALVEFYKPAAHDDLKAKMEYNPSSQYCMRGQDNMIRACKVATSFLSEHFGNSDCVGKVSEFFDGVDNPAYSTWYLQRQFGKNLAGTSDGFCNVAKLYDLLKYVLNKAMVNLYTTHNLELAIETFDTLNDIGMPLTEQQRLRSRLLRSSGDQQRQQAHHLDELDAICQEIWTASREPQRPLLQLFAHCELKPRNRTQQEVHAFLNGFAGGVFQNGPKSLIQSFETLVFEAPDGPDGQGVLKLWSLFVDGRICVEAVNKLFEYFLAKDKISLATSLINWDDDSWMSIFLGNVDPSLKLAYQKEIWMLKIFASMGVSEWIFPAFQFAKGFDLMHTTDKLGDPLFGLRFFKCLTRWMAYFLFCVTERKHETRMFQIHELMTKIHGAVREPSKLESTLSEIDFTLDHQVALRDAMLQPDVVDKVNGFPVLKPWDALQQQRKTAVLAQHAIEQLTSLDTMFYPDRHPLWRHTECTLEHGTCYYDARFVPFGVKPISSRAEEVEGCSEANFQEWKYSFGNLRLCAESVSVDLTHDNTLTGLQTRDKKIKDNTMRIWQIAHIAHIVAAKPRAVQGSSMSPGSSATEPVAIGTLGQEPTLPDKIAKTKLCPSIFDGRGNRIPRKRCAKTRCPYAHDTGEQLCEREVKGMCVGCPGLKSQCPRLASKENSQLRSRPLNAASETSSLKGIIVEIKKGCGFIGCERMSESIYFSRQSLHQSLSWHSCQKGLRVRFRMQQGFDRAIMVWPDEPNNEEKLDKRVQELLVSINAEGISSQDQDSNPKPKKRARHEESHTGGTSLQQQENMWKLYQQQSQLHWKQQQQGQQLQAQQFRQHQEQRQQQQFYWQQQQQFYWQQHQMHYRQQWWQPWQHWPHGSIGSAWGEKAQAK